MAKRDKPYCMDFEKLIARGENPRGIETQEPNKTTHVRKSPDMAKVREQ